MHEERNPQSVVNETDLNTDKREEILHSPVNYLTPIQDKERNLTQERLEFFQAKTHVLSFQIHSFFIRGLKEIDGTKQSC